MLASSYYPAEFRNWPLLLYWFMGAVTVIMLFVSGLLTNSWDHHARKRAATYFKLTWSEMED